MLKSQIMKGDDFKEWGQQLKEEILQRPRSPQYSNPSIHFILTIYSSFIHPISFLKKKTKRASSPFSWNFHLQVSKKDGKRAKDDHKETPITHIFILPLITINYSTIFVIFSTPLLQFTKGLCFLQDDLVGITVTQKSYRRQS